MDSTCRPHSMRPLFRPAGMLNVLASPLSNFFGGLVVLFVIVVVARRWPTVRLFEPAVASMTSGPTWEEFPKGLRDGVDAYLDSLTRLRRMPSGRRIRPCKASMIRVCRAKLVAAARTAVRAGAAPEALQNRPALGCHRSSTSVASR